MVEAVELRNKNDRHNKQGNTKRFYQELLRLFLVAVGTLEADIHLLIESLFRHPHANFFDLIVG